MEQPAAEEHIPSILVVDDTVANLRLLAQMLREQGYCPRPVPSGRLALQAAASDPPDLVLLDITMPEMDGYEVCRRLRADPALADIPVIFISALTETEDKVKAFGAGGVDYITKPFQFAEVEARVRTHLELRRQKRDLQESYERLRRLETLRDDLTHMIVHDMRTPLTVIGHALHLLGQVDGERLSADGAGFARTAAGFTEVLTEMVSSLLDIAKIESGELKLNREECDLVEITEGAMRRLEGLNMERHVTLSAPDRPATLLADPMLLPRVVQNLLGNALKYTPRDGWVRLAVEPRGDCVRFSVQDNGPGVPPEYHERIFEKFGQVEGRPRQKHSTGLGLTFCKLAVEAHGGAIGIDSEVGRGSTFWFVMPRGS